MKKKNIVYTVTLSMDGPHYRVDVKVGNDDFATTFANDRQTALDAACGYIQSTQGYPTDSLTDPLTGATIPTSAIR